MMCYCCDSDRSLMVKKDPSSEANKTGGRLISCPWSGAWELQQPMNRTTGRVFRHQIRERQRTRGKVERGSRNCNKTERVRTHKSQLHIGHNWGRLIRSWGGRLTRHWLLVSLLSHLGICWLAHFFSSLLFPVAVRQKVLLTKGP
jgi:hypothetical protein